MQRWLIGLGGVVALATSAALAQTPQFPGPGGIGAGAGQAQAPTGTGLILGQVVDGSSGQPIDDATITLVAAGGMGGRGRGVGPSVGAQAMGAMAAPQGLSVAPLQLPGRGPAGTRLLTDTQGRFVFHDLPAASFSLTATASGYVPGAYGQSKPNGASRPLALADGQRVGDAKIRLWKYSVVGGSVIDELGEAAVGVRIVALRRSTVGGHTSFGSGGTGTTDDRGEFRISTLVPGDYVIAVPETQVTMPVPVVQSMIDGLLNGRGGGMIDFVASGGPIPSPGGRRIGDNLLQSPGTVQVAAPAADGRLGVYLTEFYPAAASVSQATIVSLQSGEERSTLALQLRVAATSAVSGSVVGPDGPLANAPVKLTAAASDDVALGDDFASATTLTRADGSFTLLGVAPGQYIARVVKLPRPPIPSGRGGALAAMMFGDASASPGQTTAPLYGQAAVAVAGADIAGVSIQMRDGARLVGRVDFSGAAAVPPASQLQSISITLSSLEGRPVSSSPFLAGPPQPAVDANGQFKTAGYPPGRYSVVVGGSVPTPWALKSVLVNGRDVLTSPLELSTTDVEGVVISYTDKSTRLSGHVRGLAAGSTATVFIFPADYKTWIANGMFPRLMRQVTPGTPGAYAAGALPAGDYLAAALDAADVGDSQDPAWFEALARVATRVSVNDGEAKTLDLTIVRIK